MIRVLIIDDQKDLAQMVADWIKEGSGSEFEIIIETNGEEAVEKLRKGDYGKVDVILLDTVFSDQEYQGYEICELIKEFNSKIPIISISTRVISDADYACERFEIGNDPEKFISFLKELLGKK